MIIIKEKSKITKKYIVKHKNCLIHISKNFFVEISSLDPYDLFFSGYLKNQKMSTAIKQLIDYHLQFITNLKNVHSEYRAAVKKLIHK